jgi:hypothetical protein
MCEVKSRTVHRNNIDHHSLNKVSCYRNNVDIVMMVIAVVGVAVAIIVGVIAASIVGMAVAGDRLQDSEFRGHTE